MTKEESYNTLKQFDKILKQQEETVTVFEQAENDYKMAKDLGLTHIDRWEKGIEHHPMSERLVRFLVEHDFEDYNDYFCFKVGGDGDNGETLMYEMDAFFEMLDLSKD